jgi:hypothetical protein
MVPYLGGHNGKAIGLNKRCQHHRQENERQCIPEFAWLPTGGTVAWHLLIGRELR